MHVRPISIPRSTSPHAAASAQQHRRARLRAHISAYYGAHKHGMQALARTPPRQRQRHLPRRRPLPLRRRRAVAATAPPQHARERRLRASWCSRPGEQAAVSGGATATRAASAGGDALLRRAPCTPDTHQRKHTAPGGRLGALPCYAPSTPMHAHTSESRGLGWRIHGSVEDTKLNTN